VSKKLYDYGPFSVGDIVNIYRRDADTPKELHWVLGEDVAITGPLGVHPECDGEYLGYEVRHASGYKFYAGANEVRRRPPNTGERSIQAMFESTPRAQPMPEVA
jgi:hypothetical protein